MKALLLLTALFALAASRPAADPSDISDDEMVKILTYMTYEMVLEKDVYSEALEFAKLMSSKLKGAILPLEFYEFVDSITEKDFRAVKAGGKALISRVLKDGSHAELVEDLKKLHPDFYTKAHKMVVGLRKKWSTLTPETRKLAAGLWKHFVAYWKDVVNSDSDATPPTEQLVNEIFDDYVKWPESNKKDLDKMFPKLSVLVKEMKKNARKKPSGTEKEPSVEEVFDTIAEILNHKPSP
ncbi:hypothetical protein QR680_013848 [Steinernema hermaphroditum]|uniref:Fatty-acid and retinol-binding protein 1 n=1 Tax=Steinernema hermaphroditum TaxID=289476 RepID=A0AA39I8H0_9BILA|nr:hypothetical protein QR680_013848 [Steinernema hermaphroditum]